MKRINIYINEDTDKLIDTLAEMMQINRSEVIRQSLLHFKDANIGDIEEFMDGVDFESPLETSIKDNELILKCKNDPAFFIENAINILTPDGYYPFKLYDFQSQLLFKLDNYDKIVINKSRQLGISVLLMAYALHYCLANKDKLVIVACHKIAMSIELVSKLVDMVNLLPAYLKESFTIIQKTKSSITFSNGCRILATHATIDRLCGINPSLVIADEIAFGANQTTSDFIDNLNIISSSNKVKIIIASTPNGINPFYKLWADAISNFNDYHAIKMPWTLMMHKYGRDEEWKSQMIKSIGLIKFMQEFECWFDEGNKGDLYA